MRQCELCEKGSKMGGARRLLRGHYNPVNWSRKYPNLQYAKVNGVRARICTNCLKTIAKKATMAAKPKVATAAKVKVAA